MQANQCKLTVSLFPYCLISLSLSLSHPPSNQLPLTPSHLSFPLSPSLFTQCQACSEEQVKLTHLASNRTSNSLLRAPCSVCSTDARHVASLIPRPNTTSHLRHRDHKEASAPVDGVLCTKCPSMTGFMAGTIKYACAIGWERLWLSFSLGPGYRISPLLSSQGPAAERERDELALPFFSFIYPPFI